MYWNKIASCLPWYVLRWIVTLDVLKYYGWQQQSVVLFCWIVTLDVLKSELLSGESDYWNVE